MDRGKLVGFYGLPVSHGRERPLGFQFGMEERRAYKRLPRLAALAGLELIELHPISYGADPYILYDRWGHILYQWPDDYEPSWYDVMDICKQLGLI